MLYSLKYYILLFICCVSLQAQTKISATEAEKKTYEYFINGAWKNLINTGNTSLKEGYDYFYMRYRMGVAYYELKKYRLAIPHFKKALSFNKKHELSKEFLYFCYVFSNQQEYANKLAKSFPKTLQDKIGFKPKKRLNFVMFEAGLKSVNSEYREENNTTFFNNAYYAQLGIHHNLKSEFSIFHAFSYFSQESSLGNVNQYQYYLNTNHPLGKGWNLKPAFHFLKTNFEGNQSLLIDDRTDNNSVYSIALSKNVKKLAFTLGTTFSKISNVNMLNYFGQLSYDVFGNNRMLLGTRHYFHKTENKNSFFHSFSPSVDLQLLPKLSIRFDYFQNQENNIIEQNGYLVNNASDLTTSRYGTMVNWDINKKFSIYGLHQFENKNRSFSNEFIQIDFDYNYNLYLIGLRFRP